MPKFRKLKLTFGIEKSYACYPKANSPQHQAHHRMSFPPVKVQLISLKFLEIQAEEHCYTEAPAVGDRRRATAGQREAGQEQP